MNCKSTQEKICGALASGELEFGRKLGQHLQNCAACRAFFADKSILLQAIDWHLRALANEPVPPSLVPGVFVRLTEELLPGLQGARTWQLAAIAALVVLSAAVSIPLRRSVMPEHQTGSRSAVAPSENSQNDSRPTTRRDPLPAAESAPPQVTPKASVATTSPTPEVLVLREEQEAYAHFVNKLALDRGPATAPAFAKPASDDGPVEIALLLIKSVEVRPLEGIDSE
jgi:hypothetical protein